MWHLDGYDQLKSFGLCIRGCIDGFSRKIIDINIYYTNNNPSLISGYLLKTVKEHGGCPRVVRWEFQNYCRRIDDQERKLAPYIDDPITQIKELKVVGYFQEAVSTFLDRAVCKIKDSTVATSQTKTWLVFALQQLDS